MMRGVFRASLLAGVAVTALSPSQLAAQEADARATQLAPVVIEGEAGTDQDIKDYVARSVSAGTKTDTPLTEVPQSVSVVGREEIEVRGAQKTDEALRYTAGVFAQPYGADSDTDWIFIRGFDATQTGAYLDGMPLFFEGYGSTLVDPYTLERIEVLKGAASVLYGGSNPGGLVNYVSKLPTGERIRRAEAGYSSSGKGSGYSAFDIGDAFNDRFDYRLVARFEGGKDSDKFDPDFKGVISPSLRINMTDATRLTILANYTAVDEHHIPGTWLPYEGTVTEASFGRISRDFNASEPDYDYYTRTQGYVGYELEHDFGSGWSFSQKARYTHVNVGEQQVLGYGYYAAPGYLGRGAFKQNTSMDQFVADTSVKGEFGTGPLAHKMLLGTDYRIYTSRSAVAFGSAGSISVLNPVYGLAAPSATLSAESTLEQQQAGFYLQDQIRFGGGWIVTLNGRYDKLWTDNKGTQSRDGAASGRAGIAYETGFGLTPYASVATFFNPQLGTTFGGEAFKPETGTQYEAGLKYQPGFMNVLFTASIFDLTRQNVQTADPVNAWQYVQTGEVRSRGIELEAKGEIARNLRATLAFTAYDLEITKDNTAANVGKVPLAAPEVQGSFWLDYGFDGRFFNGALDGLSIGGGLRYVGETFADNANLYKVPAVTLADARIGYKRDNWGLDLNATNIFDKRYVSACNTAAYCYYGEGRTLKLRLHTTW